MPATSPARVLGDRPVRVARFGRKSLLNIGDDQIFAKVHSIAIQAALSVLLSIFGLGSAMAQSIDQDMALGANTQATRDRVVSEIRQAREDGAIKRWSPVLVELPVKAPLRGSRFAPFATHRAEDASRPLAAGGDAGRWSDVPLGAARAPQ